MFCIFLLTVLFRTTDDFSFCSRFSFFLVVLFDVNVSYWWSLNKLTEYRSDYCWIWFISNNDKSKFIRHNTTTKKMFVLYHHTQSHWTVFFLRGTRKKNVAAQDIRPSEKKVKPNEKWFRIFWEISDSVSVEVFFFWFCFLLRFFAPMYKK